MRILVCGGRNYTDYHTIFEVLDGHNKSDPISCLIEGGALGADRFARRWARERGVQCETFEAEWDRYGTLAGPIRNARMLKDGLPDKIIAFPGGWGTADMVKRAKRAKVPVLEITEHTA